MRQNRYLFLGLTAILIGFSGLMAVNLYSQSDHDDGMGMGMMGDMMTGRKGMMGGMMGDMMKNMEEIERKTEFSSNGERIFYSGTNSSGEVIKNSHGMEGVGCAMCHGAGAEGMRMMMMHVPPLDWDSLTDPKGHTHSNGKSRPPFTESSFKVCVLAGIDPAGNVLSTMMPKWEITNEDLDDLIEYLKTK